MSKAVGPPWARSPGQGPRCAGPVQLDLGEAMTLFGPPGAAAQRSQKKARQGPARTAPRGAAQVQVGLDDHMPLYEIPAPYQKVATLPAFERMMARALSADLVALDTETCPRARDLPLDGKARKYHSLTAGLNQAIGICLSFQLPSSPAEGEHYYVPLRHAASTKQLGIEQIRPLFGRFLRDPRIRKVFHHAKFDLNVLRADGFEQIAPLPDDTCMVASLVPLHELPRVDAPDPRHVLEERYTRERPSLGLKPLACRHLDPEADRHERAITHFRETYAHRRGLHQADVTYDLLLVDLMVPYAASDTRFTLELLPLLGGFLDGAGERLYRTERALIPILADMEYRGARIDRAFLERAGREYEAEIESAREAVFAAAGRSDFDPASNAQLVEVFQEARLPLATKTATGRPSVDKATLARFAKTSPLARAVSAYRRVTKLKGTYVDSLLAKLDERDHVHCSFRSHGTRTGRLSSDSPNLQNCPGAIREAFVPPDGEQIVMADYCFATGTLIDTPSGTEPIDQMRPGDLVYSYHAETRRPRVGQVNQVVRVGVAPVLKVRLDNGMTVRCTAEHQWLVCPGAQEDDPIPVRTNELRPGDRLLPLRRVFHTGGYVGLYAHKAIEYAKEHVEVARTALGERPEGHDVHHRNGNRQDNRPENLQYVLASEHKSEHSARTARRCWDDPETAAKMARGISRALARRGGHGGERNPRYGDRRRRGDGSCLRCGASFTFFLSTPRKYCSRDCYALARAQGLNHRVVSIWPDGEAEVWSLGVTPDHNYALAAGVFVLNSQIELRLAAHYSRDPVMLDAFSRGDDIHTRTAIEVFGATDDPEEAAKRRKIAKSLNFAICYGAGAAKIADMSGEPIAACEEHLERFYRVYTGLARWKSEVVLRARTTGEVRNLYGRRRWLPILTDRSRRNTREYWKAERVAVNTLIQGSAADMFKETMVSVAALLGARRARTRIVLSVHDELVFYVPPEEIGLVSEIQRVMEQPAIANELLVPLVAEVTHSATNWKDKRKGLPVIDRDAKGNRTCVGA